MTSAIAEAAEVLQNGGVVCHACEGVWGLACDPFIEQAVQRILHIKDRPAAQGLIVIAAEPSQFKPELGLLTDTDRDKVESSWPGHVTWILPTTRFPTWVTGDFTTIATRVPAHPQARDLAREFGGPLVSTSANKSGQPPCLTESEAVNQLGPVVDRILSGSILENTGPSQIFDAISGKQIR